MKVRGMAVSSECGFGWFCFRWISNLKLPFDLHPLVSDVRDPPSTASYSDRVNFGLGGVGSGGFVKLSVGLDSPT